MRFQLGILIALASALAVRFASAQAPESLSSGMKLVAPSGSVQAIPKNLEVGVSSEVLQRDATLADVLNRYGLKDDSKSIDMVYRFNPQLKPQQKTLPAGSKLTLIAPDETSREVYKKENWLLTWDKSDPSAVLSQKALHDASENRAAVNFLPRQAYLSEFDKRSHVEALGRIETAARTFDGQRDRLSGSDYMVVSDYLDYATRKSALLNTAAKNGKPLPTTDIKLLDSVGKTVMTLLGSGKPKQNVTVIVSALKGKTAPRLTVYALPGPLVDDPDFYKSGDILGRLNYYSFANPTSPSSGQIDSSDARLWVGPFRDYDAMVDLVKKRKLAGKYNVLNSQALSGKQEVRLIWPDDVVK
jgi:hypothetical protein